jgi:hypothetical protein
MDVETLAKLLHTTSYEVDKQNKKRCSYNDVKENGVEVFCDGGEVFRDAGGLSRDNDEKCPQCNGTGLESFNEWKYITEIQRENYRIQARFILKSCFMERWRKYPDEKPEGKEKVNIIARLKNGNYLDNVYYRSEKEIADDAGSCWHDIIEWFPLCDLGDEDGI